MEMAASATELPRDLINEILLRLPAKSVGRFRCVSKPWKSHLTSPKFVKSHRKFHINGVDRSVIVPVSSKPDGVPPHLLIVNSDGTSRKVTSPFFQGKSIHIHAVCHGFVLVELDHYVLVFNPLTLEALEVPDGKIIFFDKEFYNRHNLCYFGLGYDSLSDEYRIVRLLNHRRDSPKREFDGRYVEVYSFKKKCWSRIMSLPYQHHNINKNYGLFVNGRLYWQAWGNKGGFSLAAFNLAQEKFEEVSVPTKEFTRSGGSLKVFGGCFAVVNSRVIWVMKEDGAQESWNRMAANTEDGVPREFICLLGVDELVFRQIATRYMDRLVVYSLSTGVWREWDIRINLDEGRVLPFTECLLSPKHISG